MTHYPDNHAVVSGRFRYIRYADGFEELYDHQNDTNEFINLLPDPSRQPLLEELRKSMPEVSAPWIDGLRPIKSH